MAFDVYTQTCYYGEIVEGLEKVCGVYFIQVLIILIRNNKEFNFKWNYSKNIYDNDNIIERGK